MPPKHALILTLLCVSAAMFVFFIPFQGEQYDILILNGKVFDGTGDPASSLDIGIVGDRIIAVGNLKQAQAKRIIDANGHALAPGFIDVHAHLEPLTRLPAAESHLRQGVTTALGGPDGGSPWPFGAYVDSLERLQLGINVAYLTGHNTIRENVMKLENRAPTADELNEMKRQVEQAMLEGAFGLSTGLKCLPGAFSNVEEVIELSKVASRYGGFYTSHFREEGFGLLAAVEEAILIGKEATIPVVLTHHKVIGKPMWGASVKTLALVDAARAQGQDVMIDQYPYTASSTGISVLIPTWANAGGSKEFKSRIGQKLLRDSIKKEIVYAIQTDRGGGDLSRIQFGRVLWMKELEGKTLYDWCRLRNMEPTIENGAELVIEAELNGGASCIFHAIDEQDIERIMKHPQTMIASDGRLTQPGEGHPHPRAYGTFPRVLGHYTRERNVLTLEDAIRKMTSLPAKRMGLKDRGTIAQGMKADLVVFNAATVSDKGTFDKPHQYPHGIEFVLVNGLVAVDRGTLTNQRGGRVLYGPSKR